MKISSHKGARTETSAGNYIKPLGDPRDQQRVTVPVKGNQEATGHPEGQDKVLKSNECKGTMQRDGKTERRLLFMIAAGTMCQTTSYSQYSWSVAVSMLLTTGARGRDTDKAWDLNNMPVDGVVIAPEALSPKTPVAGGTPIRKLP